MPDLTEVRLANGTLAPTRTHRSCYFVYALLEPAANIRRYIGATRNPRQRFMSHLVAQNDLPVSRWITQLRENNEIPRMEIVATVEDVSRTASEFSYAQCVESYVIAKEAEKNRRIGHPPLLNIRGN